MYIKVCEHCGVTFETKYKKQRFHNFRCSRDYAFVHRTGFYEGRPPMPKKVTSSDKKEGELK